MLYFIYLIFLLFINIDYGLCFQCNTCNVDPNESDTKPCVDKIEECDEGVTSCSTVSFVRNHRLRIRKFCTNPGILYPELQIGNYVQSACKILEMKKFQKSPQIFPRKSNIKIEEPISPPLTVFSQDNNPWAEQQEPLIFFQREKRILNYTDGILNIRTVRSKRIRRNDINIGPPAPPQTHTSTILCVCDTEMCNGGEMDTIIQRATENSLKTLTKPLIALPTIDQNQLLNNNQKPFKTNILKPIKKTFDS